MAGLGTTFVLPDQPIDTVEDYLSQAAAAQGSTRHAVSARKPSSRR